MTKAIKNIKAFIPFAVNDALYKWCRRAVKDSDAALEAVKHFLDRDPGDNEWNHLGLAAVMPGEDAIVHDLDGAGFLFMYRWAERKLPASVRDEELKKRYDALVEKEGRALNKREFAQLREDVEVALLPKAFIVPKLIPVIVTAKRLFVCTSSATMCEKIMTHLQRMCETRTKKIELHWSDLMTAVSPSQMLTQIVREGFGDVPTDDDFYMIPAKAAVFKGDNKNTVRVKDRDLSHEEFKTIVNSGDYSVTELAMRLELESELLLNFTLTDKLIFKGIKLGDVMVAGTGIDAADLHATYWLFAKEISRLLEAVLAVYMDGQDNDGHGSDDDEDEL